ncbi:DUF6624 domain-containing protein [Pedobacter nototheniae]|uniref:DUF6624 domain-containing protein n=1 Tax=Pedobacter nototheniae TaxID=2488994 RepID=UPI00292CD5E4|nr:DUF6624 domain-containing protein [Pedobacter nototheniae]
MRNINKGFFAASLFALILTSQVSFSQSNYFEYASHAMELYKAGKYEEAGLNFSKSMDLNGGMGSQNDRYNMACIWSLAKKPDLAFKQLDKISLGKGMIRGWDDPAEYYKMLIEDKDLENLHPDKRWAKIVNAALAKKEQYEVALKNPLATELSEIRKKDQDLRLELDGIRKKNGPNTDEEKALWKKINALDSVNVIRVTDIIDEKGWLSPEKIGYKGNQTLFLVIQHAKLSVQQKYLPVMRIAVKKGHALARDFAFLEDRVAMRTGKNQIYGSQTTLDKTSSIYYLYPVADVDHLDERRAKVGLESIADYMKSFDQKWDLEAYKKELPALEKKFKKN